MRRNISKCSHTDSYVIKLRFGFGTNYFFRIKFEYSYDQSRFFAVAREMDPGDLLYNENLESKELDPKKICNYPLEEKDLDIVEYKEGVVPSQVENLAAATGFSILESILGTWNGLLYYDDGRKTSVFS